MEKEDDGIRNIGRILKRETNLLFIIKNPQGPLMFLEVQKNSNHRFHRKFIWVTEMTFHALHAIHNIFSAILFSLKSSANTALILLNRELFIKLFFQQSPP
jgi:hypothetical protein